MLTAYGMSNTKAKYHAKCHQINNCNQKSVKNNRKIHSPPTGLF